jgi:hypothetical protein
MTRQVRRRCPGTLHAGPARRGTDGVFACVQGGTELAFSQGSGTMAAHQPLTTGARLTREASSRTRRGAIAALVGLAALVTGPTMARADVLLTPFAGVGFFEGNARASIGATAGFGRLIGFEVDVSRTRVGTYRDLAPVQLTTDLTAVMANLVIRVPLGEVQPYASGGGGLMSLSGNVRVPFLGSLLSVSARDVGINIGGGLYVFPTRMFGIRGDVRYFRTVGDITFGNLAAIGEATDLPLPRLDFWRVTAGVTVRF